MKTPPKHFPRGAVREYQQYTLEGPDVWRWDFAWRDPASGRVTQYNVMSFADSFMDEKTFAERVRATAIACLEREVHRKCGMRYALANQYQLSLPRCAEVARFV